MQDFRTTDNRLIRIQDGGPALIRAGVLLNPQYAADRIKGADLVRQFANTGDAPDHELFFLQWVASAPAPRMAPEDARQLYIERELAAACEDRPALANHTTEAVHPHQDGTAIQRTRYAEGRDTLSIFAHDRQLDPAVAEDLLQGARVVQDFDRHRWANSLTVMGDALTFFKRWANQCERSSGAKMMTQNVWDKVLSEGKKPKALGEDKQPKAKAARLNREFGRFLASNLAMETQLELIRAKGKNNVITVLHRGNALDNDDHDDWKRGATIIKDLHDKNDGFYDGFTMFRDWSLQDYTPDQAERWEETVKRVYEAAVVRLPAGTTAVVSGTMSTAGVEAYSQPSVSLVDDAVLLAEAGTARMKVEPVNLETMARKCAELERRLALFNRPATDGPQVGETWWCLMPSKSRNTLQKMTITYISDKRVELLITGRPAASPINVASYRRDDVEFVEVVL
jgi:hypothetical protein